MKKKRSKKNLFVVSVLVLFVLLIILLEIQYEFIESVFRKTEKIIIEEECSLILNNLVHKVTDESGCKTICEYECEITEAKYIQSEFIENPGECNNCACYCR